MGFWAGFLDAHYKAEDRRERRELFMKEQKERRQNMLLSLAERRRKNTRTTGSRGTAAENSAAKLQAYGQKLMEWGVPEAKISELMATGDVDGMGDLVDSLTGYKAEFASLGEELPSTWAVDAVENATTVDARTIQYDNSYLYDALDITEGERKKYGFPEYDEEVVPGAIVSEPPVRTEKLDPNEIDQMQELVVNPARSRASAEIQRINSAIGKMDENVPQSVRTYVTDRSKKVQSALDSAGGDDPNFAPLVGLFGSEFYKDVAEYYPRIEDAPFDPVLKEAIQYDPFTFSVSELGIQQPGMTPEQTRQAATEFGYWLRQLGILTENDTLRFVP